jgi:hypothetical protein
MIGRILSSDELQWVFAQSERLIALGYRAELDDCLADANFAGIEPDWQQLVLCDMAYLQDSAEAAT